MFGREREKTSDYVAKFFKCVKNYSRERGLTITPYIEIFNEIFEVEDY